jgi:hypothetical protein
VRLERELGTAKMCLGREWLTVAALCGNLEGMGRGQR